MISLKDVSYYVSGRLLLSDVNFHVSSKQHIGLVGRNGTGKSTLFKLINRQLQIDDGKIEITDGWKVLSVKQEVPDGEITPLEYLLLQDTERTALMDELEHCSDTSRMADIYDRLIQIDAYGAESRAAVVLRGLGFNEEDQNRSLSTFSGGFKMRVALGAVLYQEPDLLLLDEPTNHLDLETSDWLELFLKKYPKSFILVSHDRDFLNSTVTSILHLKNTKITKYNGNFDAFLDVYTLKQKNAEAQNAKSEEKRKHMMEFVKRFHAKATKAKQAQSRLKAIARIKFLPVEKDDATVKFNFPEPDELASPILSFEKVTLGYDDNIVLKNLSGSIRADDRIAVVGVNGNGKTTFARFLAGELKQKRGTRNVSNKLKIGFYRQDQFEELDASMTAYEHVQKYMPNALDTEIRSHLGLFGFSGDKALQKINELSGGERVRLIFATLTAERPNLLILDEPTNHLDLEMRESLVSTLTTYKGAVILITHDRNFLNRVANSIFIVKNHTITHFDGDLSTYEQALFA